MKEFTDLINKLLQGFENTDPNAEGVEVKELDTFTDHNEITYLDVQLKGNLPKVALDEIRNLGYRLYHVSSEGMRIERKEFRIGFYKEET